MEGRFFREHRAASVVPHHVTSPPVGNDGGSDVVLTSNESPRPSVATSMPADDPTTVIQATVTTYQADPAQTDCEPCKTASGVDACNPPYPIVANNGLA